MLMLDGDFLQDARDALYDEILHRLRSSPVAYLDTSKRLLVTASLYELRISELHLATF